MPTDPSLQKDLPKGGNPFSNAWDWVTGLVDTGDPNQSVGGQQIKGDNPNAQVNTNPFQAGNGNPTGVLTQALSQIMSSLPGSGGQPAATPVPGQAAPPSGNPIQNAINSVLQPTYQYPFSPLQAQLFLTHFLAPYLQGQPSMQQDASKLEGMGFKINPQQTQDLQKVQDTSKAALQSAASSPMTSFMQMLTNVSGQDKAANQALRDNYLTQLRTALQPAGVQSSATDTLSAIAQIASAAGYAPNSGG